MTADPANSIARLPQGTLFVVATPIGNLGDLSARARTVLAQADLLLAEDTRHTRQLLAACGVERPAGSVESLHEHNEAARAAGIVERLRRDGYPVLDGPRRTGDGYYESVVQDPDGNRVEIAA